MITKSLLDKEIEIFKIDLKQYSTSEIVQKRLIFGDCQMLNKEQYFGLRLLIAKQFKVHPNEVLVVGSAKLGFSIAPKKKFRPFGDKSDIDVVIVSDTLFCSVWSSVYSFWKDKVIWESEGDFKKYLFRGWIRPDKLPPSAKFDFSKMWWEFFREITSKGDFGPYKISGALYKSWDFLESYQNFAVQYCKDELQ
jgi:hypothetical protein